MSDYTVGCIAELISNKNLQTNNYVNVTKTKKRKFSQSETPVVNKKKIKKNDISLGKTQIIECNTQFETPKNKNTAIKNNNKQKLENNCVEKKHKSKYKLELCDLVSQTKKSLKKVNYNKKRINTKNFKNGSNLKKLQVSNSQEENILDFKPRKNEQKKKAQPEKKLYTNFTENTIFVGNLPLNYDKQKVCKVFSKYGEIDSARIRCVPVANINMKKKVASIKKEFNPNRNSLAAYVKYKSKDSVMKALEANGMILDQHHIRVDFAECNKENAMNKAVFVGSLPFDIEDDDLWEFFKNCGKINSVRVIRDSQTSMGKGFGYVNFESTSSVELALQLDGQELKKRNINIKRCTNKKKTGKVLFNKSKSAEMSNQLLSKKNKAKKFKVDKIKIKAESKLKLGANNFQGCKANEKKKRKKKQSKVVLQKKKISKILQSSYVPT